MEERAERNNYRENSNHNRESRARERTQRNNYRENRNHNRESRARVPTQSRRGSVARSECEKDYKLKGSIKELV